MRSRHPEILHLRENHFDAVVTEFRETNHGGARILLSISRVSSASLLTIVDTHKSRKPNPALYVLKIFMKKEY